jgi:hypothetical protein
VPTSDPRWSPTLNCDLGTSPAPVTADAQGTATFDGQRSFRAFKGESPQSLFNCLAPGQPAPRNALPSFSDCRVRVSTNNSAATPDQAFLPIRLSFATSASGAPAPPAAATATTKPVRRAATPVAPRHSRKTTTTTADVRVSSNARAAGTERSRATSSSGSRPASGGALTGYALVAIGLAVALAMRRWLPAQAHRT